MMKSRRRDIGLAIGLALGFAGQVLPVSAQAAAPFSAPKGCTGFLTVQMRGCIVSNHYTCKGDPAGDQWRVDFDDTGPFFVSKIDAETQWLETFDLASDEHDTLQPGGADPASFSTLLAKGIDHYDFTTVSDGGNIQHVTGFDKLTGVTRTVSGVKLEETEFDVTAKDPKGKLIWHSAGHEWINRDWRIFLAGKGIWQDQKGTSEFDNTPMILLQPGQKGFMSTQPEFDCKSVMSSLALPPKGGAG